MSIKNQKMSIFQFLKSKSFFKQILITIVGVLVLVFVLKYWLSITTNHDQKIQVPNLHKMSLEDVNKKLKDLYLSINDITKLPDEINQLSELVKLDLWSTAITYFPPNLINLKKMKFIDLRGVTYGPTFIKEITTSMNWVTFKYETPCSCVE